jgi:hypothetical protein
MRRHDVRRYVAGISGVALLALISIATPKMARAGVDGDVRAGVAGDPDGVAIGGGILTPVGSSSHWYFNPNVDVTMGDSRDVFAMNGDFHYDLDTSGPAFWVGGGPAVMVIDPDGPADNNTDVGLNVLTGIGKKHGDVRPFAQVRGTIADDSRVQIAGGIRF